MEEKKKNKFDDNTTTSTRKRFINREMGKKVREMIMCIYIP